MAIVTPTDRPKSVLNRSVIELFVALFVLSFCPFDISVGVGAFVIGLSQISSFFSWRNLTESKYPTASIKLYFSGRTENKDGGHVLYLAETLSTSPQQPLNGIRRSFSGSKYITSATKFVRYGADPKQAWAPRPQKKGQVVLRCTV